MLIAPSPFCLLVQCGDPFQDQDIVVINGTKEDVDKLRDRMVEKRAKAKQAKVGSV